MHAESSPVSEATPFEPRHVYVHVPFCARRCSYCDFAIAVRREVPVADFVEGIAREIRSRFPEPAGPVDSIYFGGGTPSRLGAEGIARLLEVICRRWRPDPAAEITIEANPEDVDHASAEAWAAAGFTRVSLGAQSFDENVLRWMHRGHDGQRVETAVDALLGAGLANWSLDLIFALPADLRRDWRSDLERAVRLQPAHISAYGLTLEPHTPFARWTARGESSEASEGAFGDEFLAAHEFLDGAGYIHYEVSNYARIGNQSRHNAAYWRRVPYVGVGPSAHSFDGCQRRWNEREFAAWLRRVRAGEDPVAGEEIVAGPAAELETLYLGLRTQTGVHITPADRPEVTRWVSEGWARVLGDRLQLTAPGWLRIDALASALTHFRSRL